MKAEKVKTQRESLISILITAILILFYPLAAKSQSEPTQKRYLVQKTFSSDPVRISGLQSKGRSLAFNEPFDYGSDWLEGLSFDVRNASDKTIVFVSVYLMLNRRNQKSLPVVFPLVRGINNRDKEQIDTVNNKQAIAVKSGDSINLSLSGTTYQSFLSFLEKVGWQEEIVQASLFTGIVIFADDSAWINGFTMQRDPDDPLKWIRTSPNNTSMLRNDRLPLVGMRLQPVKYPSAGEVSSRFGK